MTAVQIYEVLSSWIVSSKTPDHIKCVLDYVDNVFLVRFPPEANVLHGQMASSLYEKANAKLQHPEPVDVFKPEGD